MRLGSLSTSLGGPSGLGTGGLRKGNKVFEGRSASSTWKVHTDLSFGIYDDLLKSSVIEGSLISRSPGATLKKAIPPHLSISQASRSPGNRDSCLKTVQGLIAGVVVQILPCVSRSNGNLLPASFADNTVIATTSALSFRRKLLTSSHHFFSRSFNGICSRLTTGQEDMVCISTVPPAGFAASAPRSTPGFQTCVCGTSLSYSALCIFDFLGSFGSGTMGNVFH